MKKCLAFSIVIAYMIFGIGLWSAKALDYTDIYTSDLDFIVSSNDTLTQDDLDIFIDYLDNHYDNFVVFLDYFQGSVGFARVFLYDENDTSANLFITSTKIFPVYNNTFNALKNTSTNNSSFRSYSSFKNYIENDTLIPYWSSSFSIWNDSMKSNTSSFYALNNTSYISFPYYAKGIDVNFGGSYNEQSIIIGDITYSVGDKIPTYLEYNTTSTVFDEVINVNQYSQVEFTFEIPKSSSICKRDDLVDGVLKPTEYECPLLDFNYDIRNTDINGYYDELAQSFGIPYLSYKHLEDTGNMMVTSIDTIPLSDFIDNRYYGNYYIDFTTDAISLKLVVPLDYLYATFIRVYFESNLKFSVDYIDRENDYTETIDFTGKYAVTFKPKQIHEDMLLGFGFGKEGKYAVQLRDSYYSDYNILKYYTVGYCDGKTLNSSVSTSCKNTGYFVYFDYKKGNTEQVVTVVNSNYGSEKSIKATVTYDTRYFVYAIHDTPYSSPTIHDPITDEDITLGDLSNFDSYLFKETNDSFFTMFTNAFNDFKTVILEIFQNVTYFYNNLPSVLQNFFIVIFTLVLFLFLIRFIL